MSSTGPALPGRPIIRALHQMSPWLMVSAITWIALYTVESIVMLYAIVSLGAEDEPVARAVAVVVGFFVLVLLVGIVAAAVLLRSAMKIDHLGQRPTSEAVEEALLSLAHYWSLSGAFWLVAWLGSVVAFFAALATGFAAALF